jgi:hypothetical protein
MGKKLKERGVNDEIEYHHMTAPCGLPCFECYLHPYRDQAEKWHNTKVYHLCRIKKGGIEKWAKDEAGGILDNSFYDTWKL